MLDEHSHGSRGDTNHEDGETIDESVDVLAFPFQEPVDGLACEFLGSGDRTDVDCQAL